MTRPKDQPQDDVDALIAAGFTWSDETSSWWGPLQWSPSLRDLFAEQQSRPLNRAQRRARARRARRPRFA